MSILFLPPEEGPEAPDTVYLSTTPVCKVVMDRGTEDESWIEFFDPESGVVGAVLAFSSIEALRKYQPEGEILEMQTRQTE